MLDNLIGCPHFGACSGCVIDTDVDQLPLLEEVQQFFLQRHKALSPLQSSCARGWRCRAKLAVQPIDGAIGIGLFAEGTHKVQAIPNCRVHHPNINLAMQIVRQWIDRQEIPLYDERTGMGDLRYLLFAVQRMTGRVQLTCVVNAALSAGVGQWQRRLSALWDAGDALWHSLWLNGNQTRTNTIVGRQWLLTHGEPWLWDRVDQVDIAFHPGSFAQANQGLFEKLIQDIAADIPSGAGVAEYYAGVGAIGINLLIRGANVKFCERNTEAHEAFQLSLQRLPEQVAKRAAYSTGPAENHLNLLQDVDLVLVDPPRKGLDYKLLEALMKMGKGHELVYISCGWPGFRRDCEYLLQAGWDIQSATPYLLLPGTNQLELVVRFGR